MFTLPLSTLSKLEKLLSDDSYSVEVLKGLDINIFMMGLTIFVLAIFVGYYVVWNVTPALHSPLMAVTNAISSITIIGALAVTGSAGFDVSKVLGFLAIILASVNIFGGFFVAHRMLKMFKKKK